MKFRKINKKIIFHRLTCSSICQVWKINLNLAWLKVTKYNLVMQSWFMLCDALEYALIFDSVRYWSFIYFSWIIYFN